MKRFILSMIMLLPLLAVGQNEQTITNVMTQSRAYKSTFVPDNGDMLGVNSDLYLKAFLFMSYDNEMYDNIEFGWMGEFAINVRTSGVSSFATNLYDVTNTGSAEQTTESLQSYIKGLIAPTEHISILSDGTNDYTHDDIIVSGTYTITTSINTNGKNVVTHTEVTSGTLNTISWTGNLNCYVIRNTSLTTAQKEIEAAFLQSVYPEIPSKEIGEQTWATSNLDIVATCEGTVIANVTEAVNVEKHTQSNAASDPNGTEADATTGWLAASVTLTSDATSPQTGAYCLKGVSITSLSDWMYYTFNPIIGKKYKVSIWAKRGIQGTTQSIRSFVGFDSFDAISITSTDWVEYIVYVTANSTNGQIRIYANITGAIGDEVFVDNVSVEEVGWSGSQDLYTGLVAQGESVYDATAAASMWSYYNNDSQNGAIYGKLYNFWAASLIQLDIDIYNTANPTEHWGWHVPTQAEFTTLQTELGGSTVAGGKMKVEGEDYWSSPNTGATNSSGFTMLPSGYRYSDGVFYNISGTGYIAGTTGTQTYRGYVTSSSTAVSFGATANTRGHSIRLIKD